MNLKIKKAHELIKAQLPKTYYVPNIKVYKTIYTMLRAEAKENGKSYKHLIKWYSDYWKKQKQNNTNYINTKYYKVKSVRHYKDVFKITAIGSDPIKINKQNVKSDSLTAIIFLLLHEIGHHYYKKKNQPLNERKADMFAIRWCKKINKYLNNDLYDYLQPIG